MRIGILGTALGALFACAALAHADEKHADDKHGGAHKSKAAEVFARLDKNHDGKLDADEVRGLHGLIVGDKDANVGPKDFEEYVSALSAQAGHVAKEESKIDLFKGAIDLSIYTIIVFLILFALLRAFAWGPIRDGLDKREKAIARDKHEAEAARKEAEQTRHSLEGERSKAAAEVRQMMEKARIDAEALAAQREAQSKAAAAAERDRLLREVEVNEAIVRQEVLDQGADLAALISAKVVRKSLTYEDHRALLGEALAELRAAAAGHKQDIESATV
jgi:F-type H+-transporting ATPase subunit b